MLRPKIQVPRLPPREGGSDFAQASMRLQTISRLGLGHRSHPFKLTAQGAILRIARIREKLLDTTIESLDPLRGNGIEKNVLQSGDPAKVSWAVVATVCVNVIDNVSAAWLLSQESRSGYAMNFVPRDAHLAIAGATGAERPLTIKRTLSRGS